MTMIVFINLKLYSIDSNTYCLQTLFLLFKCVTRETKELICFKNQCTPCWAHINGWCQCWFGMIGLGFTNDVQLLNQSYVSVYHWYSSTSLINSFCNIDRMFSISFAINGMFLEKSRESYDLLFVVWERVKKQGTEQRNDRNSFLFFLLLPPTPAVFLLWLFLPCALLNLTLESSNCHLSFSVHAIGSDWHYWLVID